MYIIHKKNCQNKMENALINFLRGSSKCAIVWNMIFKWLDHMTIFEKYDWRSIHWWDQMIYFEKYDWRSNHWWDHMIYFEEYDWRIIHWCGHMVFLNNIFGGPFISEVTWYFLKNMIIKEFLQCLNKTNFDIRPILKSVLGSLQIMINCQNERNTKLRWDLLEKFIKSTIHGKFILVYSV